LRVQQRQRLLSRAEFHQSIKLNVYNYSAECDLLVTVQKLKPPAGELAALARYTRGLDSHADSYIPSE
jgi:hypothetical protein